MASESGSQPIYREVQRFHQKWLWMVALAAAFATFFAVVEQFLLDRDVGNHPLSDIAVLVVCGLVGVGLPVLLWIARLIVEVHKDGVYFRFIPFHRRYQKLALDKIIKYEAVSYRPLADYGGWGIRRGKEGYAYTVSGSRGVMFGLEHGRNVLLGSNKPEEMARAVEQARIS
jgi:hypothetical protein